MTSDINNNQSTFTASDVASLINISNSTLRKYCLLLEEYEYMFYKNEKGQRVFLNKDIIMLKQLIKLKKHPDMTLKQACSVITTQLNSKGIATLKTGDTASQMCGDVGKMFQQIINNEVNKALNEQQQFNKLLIDKIEEQNNFNNKILRKLDEQNIYIRQLEKRKDYEVLEAIKQAQLEVAAAQEIKRKQRFPQSLFSQIDNSRN